MKDIVLFTACAVCGLSATADATQIKFKNFCDGMQLQSADNVNFTSTQTGACLQGTSVIGAGKVAGNHLKLIVNWRGFTGTSDKKRYMLRFPLKNNGAFKEYALQSGKWVLLNSGKYKLLP